MGELSNALQGKMNSRKSHVKDPGKKQLDLFASLADRETAAPKIVFSKPDVPAAPPRPEPEWVLPAASAEPPDVAADVRAVLSDSGPARPVEAPSADGADKPPLRTGVYHRPQRPAAVLAPPPPRSPSAPRIPLAVRVRDWFAGVELDRRMVALIAVLCALVGLIGFWSACPRGAAPPPEDAPSAGAEPAAPPAVGSAPVPVPAPAPPAPPAAAIPSDWRIPGATVLKIENEGHLIRFEDPVFVSTDKISIEGMRALKAVAAKLVALKSGARVVVTGHTDDVPLSKTTEQFRNNADIAAARAQAAKAHLEQFARANKALVFESRAGETSQAPFPNDSPQNRRLNRTATVQVFPAP
jgi:flagellar motor protein MotB